jgi:hypothetical protein
VPPRLEVISPEQGAATCVRAAVADDAARSSQSWASPRADSSNASDLDPSNRRAGPDVAAHTSAASWGRLSKGVR